MHHCLSGDSAASANFGSGLRTDLALLPTRLAGLDWAAISDSLDNLGYAVTPTLIDPVACAALASLYELDSPFRSTVNMARHGFGKGQYRYLAYPLPELVQTLRSGLYPQLTRIANQWGERLRQPDIWPETHDALLDRCHGFGQARPTPLILRYGPGDYNCLHQDLYGAIHFPLQAVLMLSAPGEFTGGMLSVVENRPRLQSRIEVVPITQGQIAIFPVRDKPRATLQGWSRSAMRHGVSTVLSGRRMTLGIIFHDAS